MAKLECDLQGDFDEILNALERAVTSGSVTAKREDSSGFREAGCRCAVRVYERYSMLGGNRVSMNITLVEAGGRIFLSAITSGGSQAMFFKVNTFGEESFLQTVADAARAFRKRPQS